MGGTPWGSKGQGSAFSLPRVWVQSLVRELRSHKLCNVAKKQKNKVTGEVFYEDQGRKESMYTWTPKKRQNNINII